MLEYLLKKFNSYNETCSIMNAKSGCVTYIRNSGYSHYLKGVVEDICVVVPLDFKYEVHPNVKIYKSQNPEYEFTLYHNYIYRNTPAPRPTIGKNCKIHYTVVMDVGGIKIINAADGSKIQFTHTGNLIIEDDVEIGAYSVIHRGTMDSTVIKRGVKIGAKTNIAHNNIIGENTVFAAGAITNGSVTIGKNCWISSGALIRNSVSICDNVVVGLGAVVIKNITEPGIYVGAPARYLKPITEGWNF